MSAVFGLNTDEQRGQLESLSQDWEGQNEFAPGTFEGALSATGAGIERGAVKAVGALRNTATGINAALGTIDEETAAERFRSADEDTANAVDYWTPEIHSVGKVGQILGQFGEMVLPLALTRGNPKLLAMTQAMDKSQELVRKGVDANTAGSVGTALGGATLLGAWLPVLGKGLAQRVIGNSVANVAVGAGTEDVQKKILQGAGYDELAAEHDPFDFQNRAVDALLGAAFGVIHGGETANLRDAVFGAEGAAKVSRATNSLMESLGAAMKPSDMDAAFSAGNIKRFQVDSAPGRPSNSESWSAHSATMEKSLDQLSKGEPVNVGSMLEGAEFTGKRPNDKSAYTAMIKSSDDLDEPMNLRQQEPVDFKPAAADEAGTTNPAPKQEASAATPEQVLDAAEIANLDQHIAEHGDFDVTIASGDDASGSITRPVSELLDQADQHIAEAKQYGNGILAAARCFMSFGE